MGARDFAGNGMVGSGARYETWFKCVEDGRHYSISASGNKLLVRQQRSWKSEDFEKVPENGVQSTDGGLALLGEKRPTASSLVSTQAEERKESGSRRRLGEDDLKGQCGVIGFSGQARRMGLRCSWKLPPAWGWETGIGTTGPPLLILTHPECLSLPNPGIQRQCSGLFLLPFPNCPCSRESL